MSYLKSIEKMKKEKKMEFRAEQKRRTEYYLQANMMDVTCMMKPSPLIV